MAERPPPRNPIESQTQAAFEGSVDAKLRRRSARRNRTDTPIRRRGRQQESEAEAKQRAADRLLEQIEDDSITRDDITVTVQDGQFIAELTEQAKKQERQQAKDSVAQDLLSQIDSEQITREDIVVTEQNGQFVASVSDEAKQNLEQQARAGAIDNLLDQIESEVGQNLQRGQDVRITEEDGKLNAELTDSFISSQEEQARQEAISKIDTQLEEQFGESLERGVDYTISQEGDKLVPGLSDAFKEEEQQEARQEALSSIDQQLEDQFGQSLERGEDYNVIEVNDNKLVPDLTDQFQIEQQADQFTLFDQSELTLTVQDGESVIKPTEAAREQEFANEQTSVNVIESVLDTDIQNAPSGLSDDPRKAAQALFEAGTLTRGQVTDVVASERLNDSSAENQVERVVGENLDVSVETDDPRQAAQELAQGGVISREEAVDVITESNEPGQIEAIEGITGTDVETDMDVEGRDTRDIAAELAQEGEISRSEATDVITRVNGQEISVERAQQAIFGETWDVTPRWYRRRAEIQSDAAQAFSRLVRDNDELTRGDIQEFQNEYPGRGYRVFFDRDSGVGSGGGSEGSGNESESDLYNPESDEPAAEQVAGPEPGSAPTRDGAVEDFAAGTGQLDELAKDRAGVGGADVDLSEITQQDRQEIREQQIADFIQNTESTDRPSVGQVATDVGQFASDVERAASTAGQLAGAVGNVVLPEPERATPEFEGISATQINNQVEAAKSDAQTTAEQFSGVVDTDTESGAQGAINNVTRGFDVASENPGRTVGAATFIFGNPLATRQPSDRVSGDVAAERANLGNLGGETAEDVEPIDLSPVGAANAQPSSQPIQATQAEGVTTTRLQPNQEIAEDIIEGGSGFLTESQERTLQAGSERFTNAARFVGDQAGNLAGAIVAETQSPVAGVGTAQQLSDSQEGPIETVVEGGVRTAGQIGNPGIVLTADRAVEAGQGAAQNLDQPFRTASTAGVLGLQLGQRATDAAVERAQEQPLDTLGAIGGGIAASVGAGYAIGRGARVAGRATRGISDRIRTAGSTDITDSIISQDVRRYYDLAEEGGKRFPDADDVAKFEDDQAAALREQATDYTPDSVLRAFEEAGVTKGVPLKKALGGEPRGPDSGRAAQGFEAPAEGTDLADQYETIGQSFGPEISPYFFGLNDTPDTQFSLRPGLPSTGANKPTGVIARTDIEDTDASNVVELNEELRDAAGDTTARTLSPDEATPEEAEALIPPEAEFADLGGSTRRNIARRLGIGSDYRVELGGRRIPVRLAAPDDEIDTGGSGLIRSFDDRGQVTGGLDVDLRPDSRRLDEFGESRRPVNRPAPIAPVGPVSESRSDARESDGSVTSGSGGVETSTGTSGVSGGSDTSRSFASDFTVPGVSSGGGPSDTDGSGGFGSRPDDGESGFEPSDGSESDGAGDVPASPTDLSGPGSTPAEDVPGVSGGSIPGFSGGSNVPAPSGGSSGGGSVNVGSSGAAGVPATTTGNVVSQVVDQTVNRPRNLPDVDPNADEKDIETSIIGDKTPNLTDFLNPITGERLETDPGVADQN